MCLVHLRHDDIKDQELMFDWLFEKFKGWNVLSHKIEKIKESPVGSRRRTWTYLWAAIMSHLDNYYEDGNYQNLK